MEIVLFGAAREMKLRSKKGRRCSNMLSHERNSSKAFKACMNSWELSQARKYLVVLRSGFGADWAISTVNGKKEILLIGSGASLFGFCVLDVYFLKGGVVAVHVVGVIELYKGFVFFVYAVAA